MSGGSCLVVDLCMILVMYYYYHLSIYKLDQDFISVREREGISKNSFKNIILLYLIEIWK